jgi:hypothetical protein
MKTRKKIKPPITRLWKVTVKFEDGHHVVYVSPGPLRGSHGNRGMIRAKYGQGGRSSLHP